MAIDMIALALAKQYTDKSIEKVTTTGGAVQSDWNQTDTTASDYIKNKPSSLPASDVSAWAKASTKPTYTASEIGADPTGTAENQVSKHNTDTTAHNDLRIELQSLADRINAVLDSDDTTLDELSEIVAYIKNNKTLIDSITTSKVNVADIINNLTTNVVNKPLSAAQGVVLKGLIDAIPVPNSAEIGQYFCVSSVDENGKITSVEAVDPWVLSDEVTGTKYRLSIVNGKLTMAESEVQ